MRAQGDQLWHQDSPGVVDSVEEFDGFGHALAAGNFGRSKHDDLAVGIPNENVGTDGLVGAGEVAILYGKNGGLRSDHNQVWHQDRPDVKGVSGQGDAYGFALGAADMGRSGHDDLAVGIRAETVGGQDNAGAVNVLYGSTNGLRAKGNQQWTQDSQGIGDASEEFDEFGWALSAGNLGNGRWADLAVGSPFEDVGPEGSEVPNAGGLNVIYGGPNGLGAANDQVFSQSTDGIGETAEDYDNFGNSVTVANFGDGKTQDLGVGVPFEDVPSGADMNDGLAHVIYGSDDGLRAQGDQLWSQGTAGVLDVSDSDQFGESLAAGDFGRAEEFEMVAGAPREQIGLEDWAGAVNVIYGKAGGLTDAGNQFWHQDSPNIVDVAEGNDFFGFGLSD